VTAGALQCPSSLKCQYYKRGEYDANEKRHYNLCIDDFVEQKVLLLEFFEMFITVGDLKTCPLSQTHSHVQPSLTG